MAALLALRLGNIVLVAAAVLCTVLCTALAVAVVHGPLRRTRLVRTLTVQLTRTLTPSRHSLLTDLGYVVISPVTETFARVLTTFGIVLGAVLVGKRIGPDLLGGFGPVLSQPRWLVVVEMIVLGDFIYYWVHRMAHSVPWLWRFHAVHHSTEHLRWSSALRAHPVEAYTQLFNVVPLFVLGFPIDVLPVLTPIVTLYALFIHCDLPIALRHFSYVLNSPVFHRVHHAREVAGTVADGEGINFAGLFPIFDALFGTYQLPAHAPTDLGLRDTTMPDTFVGQLAYPFRRAPGRDPAHESLAEHEFFVETGSR